MRQGEVNKYAAGGGRARRTETGLDLYPTEGKARQAEAGEA